MPRSLESRLFINAVRLKREGIASFDVYPFAMPAIRGFSRLEFRSPVTIFVGENGREESVERSATLRNLIAGRLELKVKPTARLTSSACYPSAGMA
jgi:predicted ATPase